VIGALLVNRLHAGPACERCGCTQWWACAGGCAWVSIDPPVCSRCVREPNVVPDLAEAG
jgi:hypothetical protein